MQGILREVGIDSDVRESDEHSCVNESIGYRRQSRGLVILGHHDSETLGGTQARAAMIGYCHADDVRGRPLSFGRRPAKNAIR